MDNFYLSTKNLAKLFYVEKQLRFSVLISKIRFNSAKSLNTEQQIDESICS